MRKTAIPPEFIQTLHDKLSIEDVVSSHVELKHSGRTLKGLCPFHNEKTPSFTVYPDTESFYCFGCGAAGDVIAFIMRIDNLDYVEAVKSAADMAGVAMPEDGYDDSIMKLKRRLLSANREAAKFFNSMLYTDKGRAGLEYFINRGLPQSTITHFGLGYAPVDWDALYKHLRGLGYSEYELITANLVRRSEKNNRVYDNFRNRVMFPIIDVMGNVIAFSGRRVNENDERKYVNTADTPVFKKGDGVFALNFAKNSGSKQIILAEGQMDAIAMHEFGFTNAVATLGTALTKEQANLIARYAEEIVICYDNDEAGRKATEKAVGIFEKTGVKIRVVTLDGGKDADEILRTYGKEKFERILNSSNNETEYRLEQERNKYSIATEDGKVKYLKAAAEVLASCSPVEKDIYSAKIAEELGVNKNALREQIEMAASRLKKQKRAEESKAVEKMLFSSFEDKNNPQRQQKLRAARAEETLIASFMKNPDFYKKLKDTFSPDDFTTEFNKRIIKHLTGLIEDGYSTDLSMFNSEFDIEEMNTVAKIAISAGSLSNTLRECEDCIAVIKAESSKPDTDAKNMSDEEYLSAFRKNNNGG
ncbi:MAG: DNA primase [Clostridia bacterium]|nr:DNA primase [Clostridia bacterium]